MDNQNKFKLPARYAGSAVSVWNEYLELTDQYNPLNLGHGFCDYGVPRYITDALSASASSSDSMINQYTRGFGHIRLVNVLAKLYSQLINRQIDPLNEVLVTVGAFEALYTAIQGHIDMGDEVIIIEPFFDSYAPVVKISGGILRYIPLKLNKTEGVITSADWVLDYTELEKMFNEKTKMIILNTPNNPLGKVFTREELEKIATLCIKWNVLCVSDEVYEWIVFDDLEHIRICTLPGMWDRTITIGSSGKTFSVTGWKIGWAYGPAPLMTNLQMVHQNAIYTCSTPIQEAIAISFETELTRLGTSECYLNSVSKELQLKRDYMADVLTKGGMKVTIPQGGYFILADWTNLAHKVDFTTETDKWKDYRFTKWMIKNLGLQAIPPSVFYSDENKRHCENYVRFCFYKKDEKIEKLSEILSNWK